MLLRMWRRGIPLPFEYERALGRAIAQRHKAYLLWRELLLARQGGVQVPYRLRLYEDATGTPKVAP